jgi:hypothetical protein
MAVQSVGGAIFFGRVRYKNQILLPRGLYPPISVPPGVVAYHPFAASMADMIRLGTERRRKYDYTVDLTDALSRFPAGYTHTDLAVRFVNFDRQWRRDGSFWRYQGGQVCLDLTVAVYADERASDRPRCLMLILEHELLHVADEIDIVTNWLPHAVARARFIPGHFQIPIRDDEFNSQLRGPGQGEGSGFERIIQRSLWIPESSRRAARLHAEHPEDGKKIKECMDQP